MLATEVRAGEIERVAQISELSARGPTLDAMAFPLTVRLIVFMRGEPGQRRASRRRRGSDCRKGSVIPAALSVRNGACIESCWKPRARLAANSDAALVDDQSDSVAPITARNTARCGSWENCSDGRGELAGLAANLVVAPARAARKTGNANGFKDLIGS